MLASRAGVFQPRGVRGLSTNRERGQSPGPGVRQGDWKFVWRTPLPRAVELYDVPHHRSEKNNVAAANPDKVAALEKRANELPRP